MDGQIWTVHVKLRRKNAVADVAVCSEHLDWVRRMLGRERGRERERERVKERESGGEGMVCVLR